MSETKPTPVPGWYVVFSGQGIFKRCFEQFVGYTPYKPFGTETLGPNVADLLRDADRYRWLRSEHRLSEVFIGDGGDALNIDNASPEEIDALIDTEIARDREGK
jgi:hypothetical protein